MSDGDWIESSEGDLDPDLTEEAGYADWDPPSHRAWGVLLLRLAMAIVLIALLGSVVLAAVR
ncbi:MAG: hypothetical protein F4Z25_12410 [Chloroflexi bacterium]|nr:hypothetical protein [Chloroflexota bacterium]